MSDWTKTFLRITQGDDFHNIHMSRLKSTEWDLLLSIFTELWERTVKRKLFHKPRSKRLVWFVIRIFGRTNNCVPGCGIYLLLYQGYYLHSLLCTIAVKARVDLASREVSSQPEVDSCDGMNISRTTTTLTNRKSIQQ